MIYNCVWILLVIIFFLYRLVIMVKKRRVFCKVELVGFCDVDVKDVSLIIKMY